MTTTDKATHQEAAAHAVPTIREPATPFYSVGGADPDFALPPRSESARTGFWARLLPSSRRR
ncbi:hypothetical protein [Arthrobacter sp. JSM 101049]|uniref:hypothetical protein n=1 Tax=Arthrobacter sp. JSM 101049 TaxID=929097 RepID=UPI0035621C15